MIPKNKHSFFPMVRTSIDEVIQPVLGKEVWGKELGHGSFATIEFGLPVKTEAKSDRRYGEWNIWLHGCGWWLEQGDQILAGSEDPREKIESGIKAIEVYYSTIDRYVSFH